MAAWLTGSLSRRVARLLRWGVVLLVMLVFTVHFTATAIYLTPLNPIKLALYRYVHAWMNPLFTQNWHLFAPNPLASNSSLVTKCRSGTTESGWIDVTHAVLDRYYANRLSTAKAIGGMQVNALQAVIHRGLPFEDPTFTSFCASEPEHGFCRHQQETARIAFDRAHRILVGMATDGCEVIMRGMQVEKVFIRVTEVIFPRFSERLKSDYEGKTVVYDFGWHSTVGSS